MSIESVFVGLVVVLSLTLFITSVVSYRRSRDSKIAIVAFAFFLFFLKSVIWVIGLFFIEIQVSTTFVLLAIMDVAVLLILFAATLRPS
ncbi:MAG: hypothetical protein ACE5QW_07840 [Thermoplasmata archaeon]